MFQSTGNSLFPNEQNRINSCLQSVDECRFIFASKTDCACVHARAYFRLISNFVEPNNFESVAIRLQSHRRLFISFRSLAWTGRLGYLLIWRTHFTCLVDNSQTRITHSIACFSCAFPSFSCRTCAHDERQRRSVLFSSRRCLSIRLLIRYSFTRERKISTNKETGKDAKRQDWKVASRTKTTRWKEKNEKRSEWIIC